MIQSSKSQKRPEAAHVVAARTVSPRRTATTMPVAIGPSSAIAKNHSSPRGLKTTALMAATPASRRAQRLGVMEVDMSATLRAPRVRAIA
jgi:hypothetical protein